tara:strand:- start:4346 stop:4489 length:144 start_codon:yes stop_codon:yes gene_type:complete
MVNNYNLEYQLLKKSGVVNRAPSSITTDYKMHLDDYDECKCGCKDTQ